ncbi:MAG: undecaprenyl/decaprenyl-phosphate alpha-N-acetylglucosaminyl 1-phosphate transferase, partial [Gammaproteobacteria bacterium]|nr:undecaprenyl/decaprenyl-phosphate alpha-N-acetylglucosaminyl 1-phosphate transferase [Gammaproteobacteria bacterium]
MSLQLLKSSLIAVLVTIGCIRLLRPVAVHIGFVDQPGGRKNHQNDIPLIGGIAIFFGFGFAVLTTHLALSSYRDLLAGSAVLMLLGVVDDFQELSSKLRLFGQLLASLLIIIWGNQMITSLGNVFFFGNINLGLWGFPLTCFLIVAYINAMNMLDGQDGLSASIALGQALLLIYLSLRLRLNTDARLLFYLAASLCAFLYFNLRFPWRKQASIFLGDHGITFV